MCFIPRCCSRSPGICSAAFLLTSSFKAVEQEDNSFLNEVLETFDKAETTNQDSEPKGNPNQANSGFLDQMNAEGNTMMHISASKRDIESTRLLLNHGANCNLLNAEANTPLHIAVGMKDIKMTRLLLEHKADPSMDTPDGNRLMHKIVDMNDIETTKILLLQGADPNLRNKDGDGLMHLAAKRNDIETTELLLDNGADPNLRDGNGDTTMHMAAKKNNVETARLLFHKGVDPRLKDADGKGPVDILGNTKEGAHFLVQMASEGRLQKEDVSRSVRREEREPSVPANKDSE